MIGVHILKVFTLGGAHCTTVSPYIIGECVHDRCSYLKGVHTWRCSLYYSLPIHYRRMRS